jgi:hypothetical protein
MVFLLYTKCDVCCRYLQVFTTAISRKVQGLINELSCPIEKRSRLFESQK